MEYTMKCEKKSESFSEIQDFLTLKSFFEFFILLPPVTAFPITSVLTVVKVITVTKV